MGSKTIPEVHKHPSTLAYADAEYHCERCGRALHSRGDRCRVCRPTERYAQAQTQLRCRDLGSLCTTKQKGDAAPGFGSQLQATHRPGVQRFRPGQYRGTGAGTQRLLQCPQTIFAAARMHHQYPGKIDAGAGQPLDRPQQHSLFRVRCKN